MVNVNLKIRETFLKEIESLKKIKSLKGRNWDSIFRSSKYCADGEYKKALIYFLKGYKGLKFSSANLDKATMCSLASGLSFLSGDFDQSFLFLYVALLEDARREEVHYIISALIDIDPTQINPDLLLPIRKRLEKDKNFAAHLVISIIACLRNDLEGMRQGLKRAISLRPNNFYVVYYFAKCYLIRREYENAIELYETLLSLPNQHFLFSKICLERGICYYYLAIDSWRQGDLDRAQRYLLANISRSRVLRSDTENGNKKDLEFKSYFLQNLSEIELESALLREVIFLDVEFEKIFKARTLLDLRIAIIDATFVVGTFSLLPDFLAGKLKMPFGDPNVFFVGFAKRFCFGVLIESMDILFSQKGKESSPSLDLTIFENCKKMLLGLGFQRSKEAFDAIENFALAIRKTDKAKLLSREKELIRMLKPGYILAGELSQFIAEKEYQERSIQEIIRKEFKSGTETMAQKLKSEIRSMHKKSGSFVKSEGIVSLKEKIGYEGEINLKSEDFQYDFLGLEIDYVDREPLVYFKLISSDGKDKKREYRKLIPEFSKSEKNFAILVRLAVAAKFESQLKPFPSWLHINEIKGYRGRCLYTKYQGVEEFRNFLKKCDILNLNNKEKRKLVRTKRWFGVVRLAIPDPNILIEMDRLKNFVSQFGDIKAQNYEKGTERIRKLIKDSRKSYDKFLKIQELKQSGQEAKGELRTSLVNNEGTPS